ncbi:MAG TPA: hypothetical protein VMJ10_21040 [Kofleriaceae bacterium]|nr:hypothetical protein [Kofleriaceae bacterium]
MFRRIAWTLAAVGAVWLGARITLPGVNHEELKHLVNMAPGRHSFTTGALQQLSVFALGITPLLNGFLLVELAALIVPRWRRLRHGGPSGRRVLGQFAALAAIVLATIQAYFVVRYLESMAYTGAEVYSGHRWLTIATLVAGTMIIAALVAVIGTRGLGNGYGVLLLLGTVQGVQWQDITLTPLGIAIALAAAAFVIIAAAFVLDARWRIPLPACGFVPLTDARALGALFVTLSMFGIWWTKFPTIAARVQGLGFGVLAVIAFAFLWSYAFARPRLSRGTWGEWRTAALVSVLALVLIDAVPAYAQRYVPEARSLLDPWALVLATAIALDLIEEARARRRELVPVWPLHAPLAIHDVREKLTAAGIVHHLQSRRLRTLVWFFGPWAPIMVLVPPERAPDAERILRELFE